MKKVVILIAFTLLLISCDAGASRTSSPRTISGESSIPRLMISVSGSGDKISRDFTVTGGCSNGVIEASGSPGDDNPGTDTWANFRIFDVTISDYAIENTGVMDLPSTGHASQRISLPLGTYYVTAEPGQFVDKWQYSIKCR